MPIFLEDFLESYADILVALYEFVFFLSIEIASFNIDNFSVSFSSVQTVLFICIQFAQEQTELVPPTGDIRVNCAKLVVKGE